MSRYCRASVEFLVDAVPEYGLTAALVRNLHALLMQDPAAFAAAGTTEP
jgi:hypothetical protein